MVRYPPLSPGCACIACGGCNRLEDEQFTGLAFCRGCDDETKRTEPEQMKLSMGGAHEKDLRR